MAVLCGDQQADGAFPFGNVTWKGGESMKWKEYVSTIPQVLQAARGALVLGAERVVIEAKEKGRYAITAMRTDPSDSRKESPDSENRVTKKHLHKV